MLKKIPYPQYATKKIIYQPTLRIKNRPQMGRLNFMAVPHEASQMRRRMVRAKGIQTYRSLNELRY